MAWSVDVTRRPTFEGWEKKEERIWGKGEVGGGTGRSGRRVGGVTRGNCGRDVIDEKRNVRLKKMG